MNNIKCRDCQYCRNIKPMTPETRMFIPQGSFEFENSCVRSIGPADTGKMKNPITDLVFNCVMFKKLPKYIKVWERKLNGT